jgi:mRNA-degrading endonuclease RelE of RelBE toxin-antitoxin system
MRAQVSEAVRALAANPRPRGIVRIQARPPGYYRIRVRDYRVGFHVDDANHVVRVWLIDRRERFYERAMRRE